MSQPKRNADTRNLVVENVMARTQEKALTEQLELQDSIERTLKSVHDAAAMRRAAERMDRLRKTLPITNIAVNLIRDGRVET